jgi:hypothetical protein
VFVRPLNLDQAAFLLDFGYVRAPYIFQGLQRDESALLAAYVSIPCPAKAKEVFN